MQGFKSAWNLSRWSSGCGA